MKALLEFMYRGEVSVDQENLSSLLKVAEGLKIKGLAEVSESPQSSSSPQNSSSFLSPLHPQNLLHHMMDSPLKRMASPPAGGSNGQSSYGGGTKRKRARPRRLSGSEAVPMASGLSDERAANATGPLSVQTEAATRITTKLEKVRTNGIIFVFVSEEH